MYNLTSMPVWKDLNKNATIIKHENNHLKNLLSEDNRIEKYSLKNCGMFYDFSRQKVNKNILDLLFKLADIKQIQQKFNSMMKGDKVNLTENRAALHTALRNFSEDPIYVDNKNIMPEIQQVNDAIKLFSEQIHDGTIKGSTGKSFKDIVIIGIGGSYLGTEFVASALSNDADKGIKINFLSNVDPYNFESITSLIDPETTLWIVVSKSYTTAETNANLNMAKKFMKIKNLDPAQHIINITSKDSPGANISSVLKSFYMFDFVGGRYSVTSAVGGVPLSLYLGYDRFEKFLKGAHEMDIHAATAPIEQNIPLIAALIEIWNSNFLGYKAMAIIPYSSALCKLAAHIQQLHMESNGKAVTTDGLFLDTTSGVIIFGEPGTNSQHSFFQLAHQGAPFPIEFIGIVNSHKNYDVKTNGVTNHQELWANMISQAQALAIGQDNEDKSKFFSGNRPSSTILLNDLSPENIGRLLSFYEAKTVFEAFILNINPFDQFGVELGKKLAKNVKEEMKLKDKNFDYQFDNSDKISSFYLNTLYNKSI